MGTGPYYPSKLSIAITGRRSVAGCSSARPKASACATTPPWTWARSIATSHSPLRERAGGRSPAGSGALARQTPMSASPFPPLWGRGVGGLTRCRRGAAQDASRRYNDPEPTSTAGGSPFPQPGGKGGRGKAAPRGDEGRAPLRTWPRGTWAPSIVASPSPLCGMREPAPYACRWG